MKKKMLLVGIGDYRGLAETLEAPVQEIARWEQLLKRPPYEMVPVRPPLTDARATRQNILDALDQLLAGAEDDDQLLMMFCGHGSYIDAAGPGGSIIREQVLLAYPDGANLRSGVIRFSEMLAVLEKRRLSVNVDVTFILEACFARGISRPGVKSLFAPIDEAQWLDFVVTRVDDSRVHSVRRFIDLPKCVQRVGTRKAAAEVLRAPRVLPGGLVCITAARETEAAYQIHEGGNRHRTLFSLRALARLSRNQDTFAELIQNINPLQAGFPQNADVHGSEPRLAEPVPGIPGEKSESLPQRLSQEVTEMASIRMRFLGMGCFIEPETNDPFLNRIVVPIDDIGEAGSEQHTAFVEVAEEDILFVSGSMLPLRYYRGGVCYKRWTLTEHVVNLANADSTRPFTRSQEFQDHVPLMTDVCPELAAPRVECRDSHPDPEFFTAFFNLQGGRADIGLLEEPPTTFVRKIGGIPTLGPINTPTSVIVKQYFTGEHAIITIADIAGNATAQIFIKTDALIMAGNAREADITGTGSGENDEDQFLIYYHCADATPHNPGVPAKKSAPINACSVTRFP